MTNIKKLLEVLCEEFPFSFVVEKEGKSVKLNICDGHWIILNLNGMWEFLDKLEDKEVE